MIHLRVDKMPCSDNSPFNVALKRFFFTLRDRKICNYSSLEKQQDGYSDLQHVVSSNLNSIEIISGSIGCVSGRYAIYNLKCFCLIGGGTNNFATITRTVKICITY